MTPRDQAELLPRKSSEDETLLRELRLNGNVADELLGFHAQQAVEKLLKAWLSDLGVNYPKVHTLQTLIELLSHEGKMWPDDLAEILLLTPYASVFRYEEPVNTDPFDRDHMIELVLKTRAYVVGHLSFRPSGT